MESLYICGEGSERQRKGAGVIHRGDAKMRSSAKVFFGFVRLHDLMHGTKSCYWQC